MSPRKNTISMPASASEVRTFIKLNDDKLEAALRDIRNRVEHAIRSDQKLHNCIYKIYSRGSAGGSEIKNPLKARMKANKYCAKHKLTEYNLFDLPDLIGFTVVVIYPSQISGVCGIIDNLIADGHLAPAYSDPTPPHKRITSKFGRVMDGDGYYACHYNVKNTNRLGDQPVCEIQIKTLLHDAWGFKTHDLTYKPAGPTSKSLIDSFAILGDSLSKLDEHSDLLRLEIERDISTREKKRNRLQKEICFSVAKDEIGCLPADKRKKVEFLFDEDRKSEIFENQKEFSDTIFSVIEEDGDVDEHRASCALLSYAATFTGHKNFLDDATDAGQMYVDSCTDPFDRAAAHSMVALHHYCVGNFSEAIEACEDGLRFISEEDWEPKDPTGKWSRKTNISLGLCSSAIFYAADLIDSHIGSMTNVRGTLNRVQRQLYEYAEFAEFDLQKILKSNRQFKSWADTAPGPYETNIVENEIFARLYASSDERALQQLRNFIQTLSQSVTSEPVRNLQYEYFDFCARKRLSQIERE